MPSFPRPNFSFSYNVNDEIQHLRDFRDNKPGRSIPTKKATRVLVAAWNIANLGGQDRRQKDYQLIAEIISWFDIVAIQETKDNLEGLRSIQDELPGWSLQFSDKGGNDERMAFIFDSNKIFPLEKVGEIAVPPKDIKYIKLPGITQTFKGFDRNPYISTFVCREFEFLLANCHSFFGSANKSDVNRRALEAYALSRWADLRTKDKDAYVTNIIALGDFNMPKAEPGDPIYNALRNRGLERPPHSTRIASSISTDNEYDQIMFFPGEIGDRYTGNTGVFDFDGGIFPSLWQSKTKKQFNAYLRYFISDHRPLWAEFKAN